jgi:uncharacterized protein HemX
MNSKRLLALALAGAWGVGMAGFVGGSLTGCEKSPKEKEAERLKDEAKRNADEVKKNAEDEAAMKKKQAEIDKDRAERDAEAAKQKAKDDADRMKDNLPPVSNPPATTPK